MKTPWLIRSLRTRTSWRIHSVYQRPDEAGQAADLIRGLAKGNRARIVQRNVKAVNDAVTVYVVVVPTEGSKQ